MGRLHPCSHGPLFAIAPTHEWKGTGANQTCTWALRFIGQFNCTQWRKLNAYDNIAGHPLKHGGTKHTWSQPNETLGRVSGVRKTYKKSSTKSNLSIIYPLLTGYYCCYRFLDSKNFDIISKVPNNWQTSANDISSLRKLKTKLVTRLHRFGWLKAWPTQYWITFCSKSRTENRLSSMVC